MKKVKYKSAEHKRKALESDRLQEEMYKRWGITDKKLKSSQKEYVMKSDYRGKDELKPSLISSNATSCSKKESKMYTGVLIKGIATMHKSNAIPVIDEQHMKDLASMRR